LGNLGYGVDKLLMDITIDALPVTRENLEGYSTIPIAFTATSVLRVDEVDGGLGGFTLTEEPLPEPVLHDGDALEPPGPLHLLDFGWDLSRWVMLCAFDGERRAAGAVVAVHTEGMWFLRGRTDTSALWDIRVGYDYRRRGVGRALIEAAVTWSRARGLVRMKIETQNTNVTACRFYQAMGARLGGVERFAYTNVPDEVELDWYLDL
jgi:GNAT superfamily N-acetyltransferase